GRLAAGCDVRSNGGYIVWWPAAGLPIICDAAIAPWPSWLLTLLQPPPRPILHAVPSIAERDRRRQYAVGALRRAGERVAAAPGDGKRPLFRELPPAPEFPSDALGQLRTAAEGIHELTRAPLAICAQSVLAAATLAIQAHHDVELPGAGRRPLTAIFASIAD